MENNFVKLAVDTYKGAISGNYSQGESLEALHKALVEMNGGSTKLNYKNVRDGKCNGMFAIVETIIQQTSDVDLSQNEFFMNLVEYKNIALGDQNNFYIPDDSLFFVAENARGTQAIRRQRLSGGTNIAIKTTPKSVKIYEELDRILSNRIDFNEFIDRVNKSMTKKKLDDIYAVWAGIKKTSGSTYFPVAGSYSENALIEMIDHVEAATGKTAKIVGTRAAIRKLTNTIPSNLAANDLYDIGYYGKFAGTPVICLKQVHQTNTDNFLLNDNEIYVIAGDDKPIKFVTEGEGTVIMGDPMNNADLSQEYLYSENYGVGFATAEKFGIYTMS